MKRKLMLSLFLTSAVCSSFRISEEIGFDNSGFINKIDREADHEVYVSDSIIKRAYVKEHMPSLIGADSIANNKVKSQEENGNIYDVAQLQVKVYKDSVLARAEGEDLMQFPSAKSFDILNSKSETTKKIFIAWAKHADKLKAVSKNHHIISIDGGKTYGPVNTEENLDALNAIKRRNGDFISIPFKVNEETSANNQFTFSYKRSNDNGKTWTTYNNGKIDFKNQRVDLFRIHRGIIEDEKGDLYALCYGKFAGDKTIRVWTIKSADGGVTWGLFSIVSDGTFTLNEPVMAQCADGSWLIVMRNNGHKPLYQSRSKDNGKTWSVPALLQGMPIGSTPKDDLNEGVDPDLLMMPNGVLVLSYGRPNLHLAFSASGNGDDWSNIITTVTETPQCKTSAYSNLVPVASDQLLQIHDTGANWTYGKIKPEGAIYSIVQKLVDVKRNMPNKIDLKSKFEAGTIRVKTDLNYKNKLFPEARVAGVFDGSTNYWSGAFKKGKKGVYQIVLDNTYSLSTIGLCLQTGFKESAEIQYSTDGTNWQNLPGTYNGMHRALTYTKLNKQIRAKYLKILLTSPNKYTSLNELELYGIPEGVN